MEFQDIVSRRRMARSFDDRPLDPAVVARILAAGLRGPTAGHTQAVDLVVLEGPDQTSRYWDASLLPGRRVGFGWPGLLRAPLLVLVLSAEAAYRQRYAEPDKASAEIGPPWWHVDAAFAALLLLLAATDAGLGSLFFQAHRPGAVAAALGVPAGWHPVGTVAIGHAAPDRPSSSVVNRPRRPAGERIHRGGW